MDHNTMERYTKAIREFVIKHTEQVLKNPRSFIKYPFIDPGSVYDGNVWDWDTYWSVYGFFNLADQYEDEQIKERLIEHAKGNIHNFMDHQLPDGYIPMMIEVADWPEPYLNMKHKEGIMMNMHKPFLCRQIILISDYIGDYGWCGKYFDNLEKYFACYDKNYYFENCGLYVWCDDIMIGMDNDPATFGRPKFSTANIYLNSFMCLELEAMAKICLQYGKEKRKAYYLEKRDKLVEAIQSECWDKRDKFFYSADVDIKTRKFDWFHQGLGVFWKTLPIKIRVWSGFIPMFANIATEEQAAEMVKHIFDEETFGSDYGLTTLAKDEKMFDLSVTNNPSNWLGPVWLVANYVIFRGLMNYGYKKEAEIMCERTLTLLGEDLEKTGSLHEYYNPFNGEPIMNAGFINWNVLALNMVDELHGKKPVA
ncbi:MGH1-like glycoside hydrolase domain-containing protein [Mediterraneibacter agrestimuris]|uniref:MGH1-like glycoside hydrolase domain-containing protein n=1 Tax=Mediterraneibacter agrestimuris TaxID=2941333 RepID=UPI00203F66A2|nr:trehalase family glycosidase [Mediterraneibacter agrestimuris]